MKDRGALSDGQVWIDSGILFFSAEILRELSQSIPAFPFNTCTFDGFDQGLTPIRFELYSDLMFCMNPSLSEEDYLSLPPEYESAKDNDSLRLLRRHLWRLFRSCQFYACPVQAGSFIHLGTTAEYLQFVTQTEAKAKRKKKTSKQKKSSKTTEPSAALVHESVRQELNLEKQARCFLAFAAAKGVHPHAVLLNTICQGPGQIQSHAVVEHSILTGNYLVES